MTIRGKDMCEIVNIERENRKKKRLHKKRRSTIVTIMLLFILASVGVVNAQTQGYEVYYHGESLGYVQSASIFDAAVERIENNLIKSYNNKNIVLGDGFELVETRVDNPMDVDACIQAINSKDIELYVKGTSIMMGDQEIGTLTSLDEAQRLIETYQTLYAGNTNNISFSCVEKTVPLSKTKDLSTMLSDLKAIRH